MAIDWQHSGNQWWFSGNKDHFANCRRLLGNPGLATLQWRHNGHVGVLNHQPHDCLLNRIFGRRKKNPSKLRVTGLCMGNSPVTGEFPHKRPVTRKMFPFDDVIMMQRSGYRTVKRIYVHLWQTYVTRKPQPASMPLDPLNTWRNKNVVITSKRRHFDIIASKWRHFDIITTSLLRNVFVGMKQ